jgi:Flp pilus assembly protein TadG
MKRVRDWKTNRSNRGERGTTAVEVALLAPVMVLIFLVIMDIGLVIWEHQVIQNAAREGARLSALPVNCVACGASPLAVQQAVINYLQNNNINAALASVTVDQQYPIPIGNGMTPYGSHVTVVYNRNLLFPGGALLPFTSITLGGGAVFRNLY